MNRFGAADGDKTSFIRAATSMMACSLLPMSARVWLKIKNNDMEGVKTILFAEDDLVVLTAYRRHLQQAGYHVIPAQDGLEAMKSLSLFVPDLVVLDLMMPKFNGPEVLQFICDNPRLAGVALIVLSSTDAVDAEYKRFYERADKRLLKEHCTPAVLLAEVRDSLTTRPEKKPATVASVVDDAFACLKQK